MKILLPLLLLYFTAFGSDFKKSQDVVEKTNRTLKINQKRVDTLYEKKEDLTEEFKALSKELYSQRRYNQDLSSYLEALGREKLSLESQIESIEVTTREIMPLMEKMLISLESFIALDLPFLLEERKERVESLKENLAKSDITVSGKFREILEAYKIESEYGNTIESYQGRVDNKVVEFLRFGRIGLYYKTLDGEEYKYYEKKRKDYVDISDRAVQESIDNGIKIAKKQRSPQLLSLPVFYKGEE